MYLASIELIYNCHRVKEGLELLRKTVNNGCIDAMWDLANNLSYGSSGIRIDKKEDSWSMIKYTMMIIDAGEGAKIQNLFVGVIFLEF